MDFQQLLAAALERRLSGREHLFLQRIQAGFAGEDFLPKRALPRGIAVLDNLIEGFVGKNLLGHEQTAGKGVCLQYGRRKDPSRHWNRDGTWRRS